MIDAGALLADGTKLVRRLVDDLRQLTASDADAAAVVTAEHDVARESGRVSTSRAVWAEDLYAQVAVSWVLAVVFVRFCEDNGLVDDPLLSGPGTRRALALEYRSAYLGEHPDQDDRQWLREVFTRYRSLPATGDLFGEHNPLWLLSLSADGARDLRETFQAVDPDTGLLRHDFTDPSWGTRFLGDLYQDLSEHAKKAYALLQTPGFVEEFILDRTLEPAIATFGLADTTLLDPTCGSGHFLLGAFARLFGHWREAEPGTNSRELGRRSLEAIGGVDVNPFAVAIARFRLLVAALKAGGDTRLADTPAYPIHVAVGDSLLNTDPVQSLTGVATAGEVHVAVQQGYATEDVEAVRALLTRRWSAVVGNPPYITVKDAAAGALYRPRYPTCRGKYSLGVPFTERFWELARYDNSDPSRAGYIGLITANSFMKREMGKNLVEKWFPLHEVTHLLDTSGAYIPGHGTPTVILLGRNRRPLSATVRTVMGTRGEPSRPEQPEKGLVWTSITDLLDQPGEQSAFVSVSDLDRARLSHHPWSIGGGGAAELKERLDGIGEVRLAQRVTTIGITSFTLEDDAYLMAPGCAERQRVFPVCPMIEGLSIRDWYREELSLALFPYDSEYQALGDRLPTYAERWLWPNKGRLAANVMFGQKTKIQAGLHWTEFGRLTASKLRSPLSITFAEIATQNHFVLDRGGNVFKQTAPVIKLPLGADEALHLDLMGALNSSAGAFWLRQVCHNKGRPGADAAAADEPWEFRFVHDGTKLQQFPLPAILDGTTATLLDRLAQELAAVSPSAIAAAGAPTAVALAEAKTLYHDLRAEMVAAQERLDWEAYRWYGLVDEDLTTGDEPEPSLALAERAFEIVLARQIAAGETETAWFARHHSTPITEIPSHWPQSYRDLVARRIELMESDLDIGLIERPEYKRRWATKSWDEQVREALRSWLCDRLETERYWPSPASLTTTARLAGLARSDSEFGGVAALYAGRPDVDLSDVIRDLVTSEAVPYLAACRYTETGLRKHAEWQATWSLQRREDAGEDVGDIPVPPKYTKVDFRPGAWEQRGKLDVPKERFISYPGAEREGDPTPVIGWAGWDHLARARALATWYLQARRDGRSVEYLTPLLAGLVELVPWLRQWYNDADPDPGLDRPGDQVAGLVDTEMRSLQLTADDLARWAPTVVRRGRFR